MLYHSGVATSEAHYERYGSDMPAKSGDMASRGRAMPYVRAIVARAGVARLHRRGRHAGFQQAVLSNVWHQIEIIQNGGDSFYRGSRKAEGF